METLKLLLLAVIQGATEFLPISSSGHLVIAQRLFDVNGPGNAIEIILHFGTLLAVVWFYRLRLALLLAGLARGSRASWIFLVSIVVATLPAITAYAIFRDFFENCFDKGVSFTGAMLLITGLVLLSLRFARGGGAKDVGLWRAVVVGVAQAIAMIPGISRSGSTIAAARHLGIDARESADFSFIMSLPVLAGAMVLELADGGMAEVRGIGFPSVICAVAVSAVSGYFALRFIIRTLSGNHFWMFGLYCLIAGAIALLLAP